MGHFNSGGARSCTCEYTLTILSCNASLARVEYVEGCCYIAFTDTRGTTSSHLSGDVRSFTYIDNYALWLNDERLVWWGWWWVTTCIIFEVLRCSWCDFTNCTTISSRTSRIQYATSNLSHLLTKFVHQSTISSHCEDRGCCYARF